MNVTVICFGVMREYLAGASGNRAELQLQDGATIRDLLGVMRVPTHLLHMCLVDGRRADPGEELTEGVEVTLMPPFSGGAI